MEALLLAQETWIEKRIKEGDKAFSTNLAHKKQVRHYGYHLNSSNSFCQGSKRGNSFSLYRGRGYFGHGLGCSSFGTHGQGQISRRNVNKPQCQLYGKLGHVFFYCWYGFDENFTPQMNQSQPSSSSNQAHMTHMLSYSTSSFDQSWYPNSSATNRLTPYLNNLTEHTTCIDIDCVQWAMVKVLPFKTSVSPFFLVLFI